MFHRFHRKTPVLESLFSLQWWNYIKILVLYDNPYFCRFFFLKDWRHKRVKNTVDLLLLYGEHFYGFSKSDLWKLREKNIHFTRNISIYTGYRYFEVLWSLWRFVLSLKNSHYAYIAPYMYKILPTLGNEKQQLQIKFCEKSLSELIFSRASKNLKMFYFTRPTGRVLKK